MKYSSEGEYVCMEWSDKSKNWEIFRDYNKELYINIFLHIDKRNDGCV